MLVIKTPEGYKQVVADGIDIYEYAAANGGTVMDDSDWVDPPKKYEELVSDANWYILEQRNKAEYEIKPLQYSLDVDDASDSEIQRLKILKKYVIALNRVSDQPGYPEIINWPIYPEAT